MAAIKQLKTLSTMQVAISLCTDADFKNELLYGPGFEYDGTDLSVEYASHCWEQLLHSKAEDIKKKWPLPIKLSEDIMECVIHIATQMLGWCRYHEAKYGLPHSFSVQFLNQFLLTNEGIIKRHRAIEDLITKEALGVSQRFKLACGYMMVSNVSDLWTQLTAEERNVLIDFQNTHNASQLPKIWARHLQASLGCQLSNSGNLEEDFWKESFVQSADDFNEIAVKCCLDNLPQHGRDQMLQPAAQSLVSGLAYSMGTGLCVISLTDEYCYDVIWFLISQMSEEVKRLFLTEISDWQVSHLICFLICYHLDNNLLIESLQLAWDCCPRKDDYNILSSIFGGVFRCYTFRSCKNDVVKAKLGHVLKEMWRQTSDDARSHTLNFWSTIDIGYRWNFDKLTLMMNMLTREEKLIVIFSDYSDTKDVRWLLKALFCGRLDVALWLVDHCGLDEIDKKQWLKKELHHVAFSLRPYSVLTYCVVCPLADWCLETSAELNDFKRKWFSERGQIVFLHQWLDRGLEEVEQLLQWFSLREEEVCKFKKELHHSTGVGLHLVVMAYEKEPPLSDGRFEGNWSRLAFYSWFGLNPEEVLQLKRDSAVRYFNSVLNESEIEMDDWPYELHFPNTLVLGVEGIDECIFGICVTDEDMRLEFRNQLKQRCDSDNLNRYSKSIMENCISELDQLIINDAGSTAHPN